MRGRLISIATAGALLLAVAAVVPALAGFNNAKNYATTITIKVDEATGFLKGRVKSDKAACVRERELIVNVNGEDVGSGNATSSGHYKIDISNEGTGHWEVHAPKLRVSDKVVCGPGNSKIVTVG